ncbi:hypothetical protein FH972_017073 [Carpinus fangiana]|uniref:Uncharacterized protein n=1 Tax=Carpinus fangiana TaxID=176857 RepID=A0A5N6RJ46_9ROSI|nr:hypothetical protein FH972_017073 [Carpinus fangiana]
MESGTGRLANVRSWIWRISLAGSGEEAVEVKVPGEVGDQEEAEDPTQISSGSGDELVDGRRGLGKWEGRLMATTNEVRME